MQQLTEISKREYFDEGELLRENNVRFLHVNGVNKDKKTFKIQNNMCTVTLQYDQSSALARRKMAALMATGLFKQIAMQSQMPSQEEIREDRELTQAFMAHSKRSMSDIIARYV